MLPCIPVNFAKAVPCERLEKIEHELYSVFWLRILCKALRQERFIGSSNHRDKHLSFCSIIVVDGIRRNIGGLCDRFHGRRRVAMFSKQLAGNLKDLLASNFLLSLAQTTGSIRPFCRRFLTRCCRRWQHGSLTGSSQSPRSGSRTNQWPILRELPSSNGKGRQY